MTRFICNADVDGHNVRVEATVTDDDYNIDFHTRDVVYRPLGYG